MKALRTQRAVVQRRHAAAEKWWAIDYTHERFEEKVKDVVVVLDSIGGETQQRSSSVLRRGGILISIVSLVAISFLC